MELSKIRELVDEAIADGLIFRSEGSMLSTSEGYNYAGRAALGALLDNAGQPTFNGYCKNQKSMLGWLASQGNPISKEARSILKRASSDPTARSMLTDVEREFIRPLVDEHTARGGSRPSDAEVDSTTAMLLSKIRWDLRLGNADLARFVSALERIAVEEGADLPSPGALDNYQAMGASDSQAAVANEIAHHVYDVSWKSAAYLAATSGEPNPATVVRICQEFQSFFVYVLSARIPSEQGEQASGLFCAMAGSFGAYYLQRAAGRAVGGTLWEEINAEAFQEASTEYYSSPSDLPIAELSVRVLTRLGDDRSTSIENLVLYVLQRGEFQGFQGLDIPAIDVEESVARYLAA